MKKNLWFLLLFSSFALAQSREDIRFIETSDSVSNPFSIPVDIDTQGKVSILRDLEGNFILSPLGQFKYNRSVVNYVVPVTKSSFDLFAPTENKWIEVKTKKIEIGLGPMAEIGKLVTIGLLPYKGALQTTLKHKNSKEEKKERFSLAFGLPKELIELQSWSVQDRGVYQTMGGIQAYASAGVGMVNFGSVSFLLQNKFVVSIKKKTSTLVEVKITEENMDKRQLTVGTVVARNYLSKYEGKLFSSKFIFDLSQNEHHELYKMIIKGRVDQVQLKLEASKQKTVWSAFENAYYAGIPSVAGKYHMKGRYDMNLDRISNDLELVSNENKGLFLPLRNHTRIVWSREDVMTLFWSSEMKHSKGSVVEKRFFSLGRILGIRGFENEGDPELSFGSVMTQFALGFTKMELKELTTGNLAQLEADLRSRCEEFRLPCRKNRKIRKIMARVSASLSLPWEESRKELGPLLNKEPALVWAVTKTLHLKKEIFFKFLSENYQSIQGVDVVGI